MPNIKVPAKSSRSKVTVTSYIENELDKRVKATIHLPNDDKKKYKIDSTTNHNNSVKRTQEVGQYVLSQLLPPLKSPPQFSVKPAATKQKHPRPQNHHHPQPKTKKKPQRRLHPHPPLHQPQTQLPHNHMAPSTHSHPIPLIRTQSSKENLLKKGENDCLGNPDATITNSIQQQDEN